MARAGRVWLGAGLLVLGALWAEPGLAGLPPEDECPTLSGLPGSGPFQDAVPTRLREGMLLEYEDILKLASLIPSEVWRNRNEFFHEGMRLEVGPCHRRYPRPEFYTGATRRFAGSARVDSRGNLVGYVAGLPFPPDQIDAEAPDAAIRWAWNLERRYRGAGPAGSFRIVDMPSRIGGIQTYRGQWFQLQTGHRADLESSDWALPDSEESVWIAGGRFDEPYNARHLAWRQLRPLAVDADFDEPDDTFVYVPTMRKMRRAAATWVDGLYMPRYRVTGEAGGGGMAVGAGGASGYSAGGVINPNAGESIAVTENLRRGFTGLAIRPNAYVWRMRGQREVLAPINVTRTGFPSDPERNFGPSGISVGSDRWDVRYAVVIQGAARQRGGDFDTITLYVDYQTQQPLYVVTRRRGGGRLVEVGILLHRFSGDNARYPRWPNGEKAHVFDPVASVFFDAADGGSGWRREGYDVTSVPHDPRDQRRMISSDFLLRGR